MAEEALSMATLRSAFLADGHEVGLVFAIRQRLYPATCILILGAEAM